MASLGQYLKETQSELRHVAWPTQLQTIVYTVLVALISVGIALYLGVFDYLFTTGVARLIGATPTPAAQTQPVATSTQPAPQVEFSIPAGGAVPVKTQ